MDGGLHAAGRARTGAIPELDGLRGIAILLVLARHGTRPFWPDEGPLLPVPVPGGTWDAGALLHNGWAGVDLFFVLSGFLIAHHLIRTRSLSGRLGPAELRDYLRRRMLRIAPAYYVVLGLVALGWVPLYAVDQADLGSRVAYHLIFLQDYLPSDLVVAFWSLGVEVKFYLLAPFLLLAALRLQRPVAQVASIAALMALPLASRCAALVERPDVVAYGDFFSVFRSPLHQCADALLMGVVCALVYRDRVRWGWEPGGPVARALGWVGLAATAAVLLPVPLLDPIGAFDKVLLPTVLAFSMGCWLIGSALGGGPSRLLRAGVLRFFARISYSLYLVHLLFLPGVRATLMAAWEIEQWSAPAQLAVVLPAYAVVSTAAAILLYRWVERPFLRLKDRGRVPASAVAPASPSG